MSGTRKVRVLCSEDEQDIRENIAEILRDEGFEVFEAENGKMAYESFVKNKPDIVISDIMMPELDGYGLLKAVRESKSSRNNNIPFIFLTALGQKDDVIKGVKLSANDYLVKPIDFELMIAKVKEKTINAIKNKEEQDRNILNIKDQVKHFLPKDINNYLEVISNISSILKEEPYGPLPHRKYIDDFERIYIHAAKIRSAVANAFDSELIDNKLRVEEEIIDLKEFSEEFIDGLSEKFKNRISFSIAGGEGVITKIKIDKLDLLDSFRKIFAGLFKSDPQGTVEVSVMNDHFDQIALIFYLNTVDGNPVDLTIHLDLLGIKEILNRQNCKFELVDDKNNTALMVIPSYKLIS